MRSTRATAAVARLNERDPGHRYAMIGTGDGMFYLSERTDAGERAVSEPLELDDFVRLVDGMGPQKERRVTRNDAAFERQLTKKTGK